MMAQFQLRDWWHSMSLGMHLKKVAMGSVQGIFDLEATVGLVISKSTLRCAHAAIIVPSQVAANMDQSVVITHCLF